MKRVIPLITVLCALALVQGSSARSSEVAAHCSDAAQAAAYYRVWAWHWQTERHIRPHIRGYRPGRSLENCSRARTLASRWQARAERERVRTQYLNRHIRAAILHVFGPDVGPGAVVVARCETGDLLDSPRNALRARNGQYTGIFQMSDQWEIQKYGRWGGRVRYRTVLDQVWAAYRMYRARTWQAWACRPDGSVAY